ncbi:hypothetical protein P6144_16750 [Sphingomonas sp. HITSZ_GF]|nr:hypothetical protein [Sphingomonas sp. HITSZ_GF]MDG2535312.1 hypothetical protein [Sphingomonas sp. HITSZ_GF]
MSVKLSSVVYAILAALLLSAPILAIEVQTEAEPALSPAIAIER